MNKKIYIHPENIRVEFMLQQNIAFTGGDNSRIVVDPNPDNGDDDNHVKENNEDDMNAEGWGTLW